MESTQGQKYTANLFFKGISADIAPELIEAKEGTVIESHAMGVSRTFKNVLRVSRGDKSFVSATPISDLNFIGGVWLNGYVVVFYRDDTYTYIFTNSGSGGTYKLIGKHEDYPSQYLDIDTNSETYEMFITDDDVCPIVLQLDEMIAAALAEELTYFDNYTRGLYEINKPIQLNQPVFVQLEDLGVGAGLKFGSYSYSACYSSKKGEDTPWGPPTPYIPVPESAITVLGAESYFSGLKTWGGEPSLTPSRYGIRIKLRIANLSGFDYIKIKRIANNTGQPISYVPSAEFLILSTDAGGNLIDIQNAPYNIIEFVDSNDRDWATLDDSVLQTYSTIKSSRTIRYYDRRIVLGGPTYESKILDDEDIFITESNTNKIAFPIVKTLETGIHSRGFSDIYNQVYNKSHRCGERYGFGVNLNDEQGNKLFSIPLKQGSEDKDDFTNFKFPERRDKIPSAIKRVDTITLSGTVGTATIRCNGVESTATFVLSLSITANRFVSSVYGDYDAFYAAGVKVTSTALGNTIIFTALVAGTDFTEAASIVTDTGGDLAGSVVSVPGGAEPVRQVDGIVFNTEIGYSNISCTVGTVTVIRTATSSSGDPYEPTYNFVNDSEIVAAFFTIGVSLAPNSTDDGIVLTGPTNGTSMVTSTVGNIVLTSFTTTPAYAGEPQVDTVTLTGSSGNVTITCNGVPKSISFDTSLSNTASLFVSRNASAYLPDIQVLYSGNDIIFTKLIDIGVAFSGDTTIVNIESDLAGSVELTTANATSGGELDASTGSIEEATVESWNADDVDHVYDPVSARKLPKQTYTKEINIVSVGDPDDTDIPIPYNPVTPTGRGSSSNNNNYDDILQMNIMDTVDTVNNNVNQYGRKISTVGLRIGGIDTTKLPASVKSFSIVRTPPAGRVVCQGIGMYALTEQAAGANPALVKAKNKIWFYSPEIDAIIGNKSAVYEDIKNNPDAYQLQLVAPCGFFSDFYNSISYGHCQQQDFVSMPICGAGDDAKTMFPPDAAGSIGRSDYITFGRWRNTSNQGAGIDATLTFNISVAQDVDHGKNIRSPYLELTLASNIYYSEEVESETSSTAKSKNFHEPWYIVNIIQNKNVPNNNINSYNDIGHSIRLESVVGIASGEASQTFPLVDERREDVYSSDDTATTYRYIWVDGNPWLDSNNIANLANYLIALEADGAFTPTGGLVCYGVYTLTDDNVITFDQIFPGSSDPIVPESGATIVVKYNSNSPIEVFLGDTYVADASFLAIDAAAYTVSEFTLQAPMPHYNFELKTNYHQAVNPEGGATHANIWDDQGTHVVYDIRQWLIYFTCESTVNLPLAYKNFFPNKLYAMRPSYCPNKKLDTETISEFFIRMNIYEEYNDDYPNEYLNWWYGGLSTPASLNYDYEKILPTKSYSKPKSGVTERLSMPKRIHWSTATIPGYEANKVFIPTNVYDLNNDRASRINILYDAYSDRGNNLYVITDRGAGMLLTNKNMITTAEGNNLSILAFNSSLINGEVWLSNSIGCPDELWRGKSEGSVKLPNNIATPILVFPCYNDIIMLSNNSFIQIADNYRDKLTTSLESIDLTSPFRLYSVVDSGENKLWITIGTKTYAFNFDINNWDGYVEETVYDKSFNADYLIGSTDKNILAHAVNKTSFLGLSVSHKAATRVTPMEALPYVIFSVTPGLGRAFDFTDMYISSSIIPASVEVSMDSLFADSAVITASKITTYKNGWHYITGLPRTTSGDRLTGKTLFVKITFPNISSFHDLRLVKTGYKNIIGG